MCYDCHMKLLISMDRPIGLHRLKELRVDGIIARCKSFSFMGELSVDELVDLKKALEALDLDLYVDIDIMIEEGILSRLDGYLELLKSLRPKGIYFSDLAVYRLALKKGMSEMLIYDPKTLLTNSLDAIFFLKKGLDSVVIARELTLEEIRKIIKMTNGAIDMQVAGHIMMSYSKRKFVSDYLAYIGKPFKEDASYAIKEETRDRQMMIKETSFGTEIFSDHILFMPDEFKMIKDGLRHAIIEARYLDDRLLYDIIAVYQGLKDEDLLERYPDAYLEKGYLYDKTMIKKEEER